MPATFGRLISALLGGDATWCCGGCARRGFVSPGVQVDVAKLVDYMSPFTVPAAHESFRFSRDWLRSEFARVNDPRNPEFGVALKLDLPAEHLFTHRVWLGMVGVLCQLEATVPVRPVLQRWLPGFAGVPDADWGQGTIMTQPLPPEPHDGLKADADPERVSNEREQTSGRAGAGTSGVFSPGPAPADEQPSKAVAGGTAGGDPLAGVTASEDDVADAVSGDTGPERPGARG
jgi:hypothetical protein